MFFRDQRLFLSSVLNLRFLSKDASVQICQYNISNIAEVLFTLRKDLEPSSTDYHFALFQPDLIIRSITADEGTPLRRITRRLQAQPRHRKAQKFHGLALQGELAPDAKGDI